MVEFNSFKTGKAFSKQLNTHTHTKKKDVLGTISPEQRVADCLAKVVPLAGRGAKALGNEARLETIPMVIRDHSYGDAFT